MNRRIPFLFLFILFLGAHGHSHAQKWLPGFFAQPACVVYHVTVLPFSKSMPSEYVLQNNNFYFELLDASNEAVLDRNRPDAAGNLVFRFCAPASVQRLLLRYRVGSPGNQAIVLPVKGLSVKDARSTTKARPHEIRFEVEDALVAKESETAPIEYSDWVAIPFGFEDCMGASPGKPPGRLMVHDVSRRLIRTVDSRSEAVPIGRNAVSYLSFESPRNEKIYLVTPQVISPMLLKRLNQEPVEILIKEFPAREIAVLLEGLVSGAYARIQITGENAFEAEMDVDPDNPLVRVRLPHPCEGKGTYTIRLMEDNVYQESFYDVVVTLGSPSQYTARVFTHPPGFRFLINVAGRQMDKTLKTIREALQNMDQSVFAAKNVRFFMSFEGMIRETEVKNLYADPSAREDMELLFQNIMGGSLLRGKTNLVYVTSSARTMMYRTDLAQKAIPNPLKEERDFTFSAIVIGDVPSQELETMANMSGGIYRTIPETQEDIRKCFMKVIEELQ